MIATSPGTPPASAINDERALAERALRIGKRTALGILRDSEAAADVAQEVAIAAFRGARAIRDPRSLDGWLYRVATRTALRHARREARRRRAEQHPHALPAAAAAPVADHLPAAWLSALPWRQRAALALRYVHDLSDQEIARALRCRPSTVRTLLARSRETLRAAQFARDLGDSHDA